MNSLSSLEGWSGFSVIDGDSMDRLRRWKEENPELARRSKGRRSSATLRNLLWRRRHRGAYLTSQQARYRANVKENRAGARARMKALRARRMEERA
jgi:hypothetical protein